MGQKQTFLSDTGDLTGWPHIPPVNCIELTTIDGRFAVVPCESAFSKGSISADGVINWTGLLSDGIRGKRAVSH